MTPSDIAREAAEEIAHLGNQCCHRSDGFEEELADLAAALILSAAAKMVQQTGAVEALDSAQLGCRLDERILLQNRGKLAAQCDAALQSLRALTEQKP